MAAESNTLEFDAPDLVCKSVTVYTDRAEVKRLVKTKLELGSNEVIIKKLPQTIDHDSVRVDGRGPATICEVQYLEKHVKKEEQIQEKQKELNEKLKGLETQKRELEDKSAVLQRKKEVIDGVANQVSKGTACNENKDTKSVFSLNDDSLGSLDKFIGFYAEKLTDLAEQFRDLDKERKALEEEINVIRRNLGELHGGLFGGQSTYLSREVSIILDASAAGDVELDVSYIVHAASWSPSYDIRVYTGENKAMKVHYYGQVQQNTGEDWTDTELSLSTAMPSIGGTVPTLKTLKAMLYKPPPPEPLMAHDMMMPCRQFQLQAWASDGLQLNSLQRVLPSQMALAAPMPRAVVLDVHSTPEEKVKKHKKFRFGVGRGRAFGGGGGGGDDDLLEDPPCGAGFGGGGAGFGGGGFGAGGGGGFGAGGFIGYAGESDENDDWIPVTAAGFIDVQESVMCTNFHIARSTTIPSDNSNHKVNVAVVELSPTFEHACVPSKSQFAFLKAKVTNNSQYPFLAGPVSVFLDNNFVAKSSIKAVSPQEEFSCSLGADPAVRIEYKPARLFHEQSGVWTKVSTEIHQTRTQIKNTRTDPVTLKLLEQVPLSTDEKVKVVLLKPEIPKDEKAKEKCDYKINKDNLLEWDLKIKPTQEIDIEVKYSVEYPRADKMELKEEY